MEVNTSPDDNKKNSILYLTVLVIVVDLFLGLLRMLSQFDPRNNIIAWINMAMLPVQGIMVISIYLMIYLKSKLKITCFVCVLFLILENALAIVNLLVIDPVIAISVVSLSLNSMSILLTFLIYNEHSETRGTEVITEPVTLSIENESMATVVKECVICLDDCHIGANIIALPCGHIFHSSCIREWSTRSRSCPICRTLIDPV